MEIKTAFEQLKKAIEPIYGEREASSIGRLLFEDLFQVKSFNHDGTFRFQQQLEEVINRLLANEPVQHIIGVADFYGLKFKVNPHVLIPRPETEELVFWVKETLSTIKSDWVNPNVLDIGTGSGCIIITLKHLLPDIQAFAFDISETALSVASDNAALNQVNVSFKQVDIRTPQSEFPTFDVIISNPPYIPQNQQSLMQKNVLDYEPHLALFVQDEDPLIFYRSIADFARNHLQSNGYLFFEVNEYNAEEVVGLLNQMSFREVQLQKDMSGKWRMIRATWGSQ